MPHQNILLIEDDEIVARTIDISLRGMEFQLSRSESGLEGLKMARGQIPDLVILDVVMPEMDGVAVCREMREDPLLKDVPIIFLSAKIREEDKKTGFEAGADDYLSKPFNIDEMVQRIRAVLRKKQGQCSPEG